MLEALHPTSDIPHNSAHVPASINYADIEGFPVSTVKGHKGRFVFAHVEGVPMVIMQGRVHYYEGYPMSDVVLPTRLMGLLGAKKIILTNAAGCVNYNFKPGDFMLITDHITTAVPNPLIGENIDELGTRFPDMSEVYAPELQEKVRKAAEKLQVPLQEGVYMQFTGPSYETPAEIRMCRTWGGDAAGMSTACEAVAANHMGMKVCGISCITNLAQKNRTIPRNEYTREIVLLNDSDCFYHFCDQLFELSGNTICCLLHFFVIQLLF